MSVNVPGHALEASLPLGGSLGDLSVTGVKTLQDSVGTALQPGEKLWLLPQVVGAANVKISQESETIGLTVKINKSYI